ncbi:hypothetical protein B0H17DRAFT_1144665 [Mycena rosella]|uniref:Uncharacterized protein n=1 Tax=Mycena rosella TaxID=1033263 RepID=A0AAD7CTI0_MYCRO|nr:hypothetical protein B0H17DRAFT_1144665 [Mycena rosella]
MAPNVAQLLLQASQHAISLKRYGEGLFEKIYLDWFWQEAKSQRNMCTEAGWALFYCFIVEFLHRIVSPDLISGHGITLIRKNLEQDRGIRQISRDLRPFGGFNGLCPAMFFHGYWLGKVFSTMEEEIALEVRLLQDRQASWPNPELLKGNCRDKALALHEQHRAQRLEASRTPGLSGPLQDDFHTFNILYILRSRAPTSSSISPHPLTLNPSHGLSHEQHSRLPQVLVESHAPTRCSNLQHPLPQRPSQAVANSRLRRRLRRPTPLPDRGSDGHSLKPRGEKRPHGIRLIPGNQVSQGGYSKRTIDGNRRNGRIAGPTFGSWAKASRSRRRLVTRRGGCTNAGAAGLLRIWGWRARSQNIGGGGDESEEHGLAASKGVPHRLHWVLRVCERVSSRGLLLWLRIWERDVRARSQNIAWGSAAEGMNAVVFKSEEYA